MYDVCIIYIYIYIYIYLQFCFKSGIGYLDAVFALKCVINHFVDRGSSIFLAALDVSKEFDRVNNFKLFNSLLMLECLLLSLTFCVNVMLNCLLYVRILVSCVCLL